MSSLTNRLADVRPARLDPDAGACFDPAGIMAHPRPARPGRRLPRRLPRRLVLAGLVPGAAVATAVAVLATSSAPPGPPARTAHEVLLVAADRAGTERAGTYWIADTIQGSTEGGQEAGGRMIWLPGLGGDHPLGSMDPLIKITVTRAELAAAPTDPVRLRDWLTDRIRRGGFAPTDAELFWAGQSLVMRLPVTPRLRAGAYRMLAGLDGVRSLGQIADQRGRTGTAVAYDYTGPSDPFDSTSPPGPMQTRLIIDLPTGRALAVEFYSLRGGDATLRRYTLMVSSYYTDRPPTTDDPIIYPPKISPRPTGGPGS